MWALWKLPSWFLCSFQLTPIWCFRFHCECSFMAYTHPTLFTFYASHLLFLWCCYYFFAFSDAQSHSNVASAAEIIWFPTHPFIFFSLSVCWPMLSVHLSPALCSQKGLKNVFDEAILAALEPPEPKKKRKCVLLWASTFPSLPPSLLCSAKAGSQLYTLKKKAMCKRSEFSIFALQ